MEQFETGAVRDTGGKGRMDLLPMCALIRISKHMEDALTHYPERNWEKGLPMHSMIDSAFRHLAKYVDGRTDEDHLCAAATNLLMAMWTEERMPEMQDIPSRVNGSHKERIEDTQAGVGTPSEPEAKERAKKNAGGVYVSCDCWEYSINRGCYVCRGTKEVECCGCMGNKADCDFYPELREKAINGK